MRNHLLTKAMLLLCALMAGSGSAWAEDQTLTEGFEKATATTTYNSTVTVDKTKSDCGIGWSIYYGTVSTNDKISGKNSAQMRWYSSSTSNYPYIKSTTAVDNLKSVSLKARTSSLDVKLEISYSANGESWTTGKTHTFTATGTGEDVSLDIPSGNKYVKFGVSTSSTAPSSGNYKLIVDDVTFTYTDNDTRENATWTLSPTDATVEEGGTTNLTLTTNYDETLTFTSNNTGVATVSYNSSTKVITVTGVAVGTTTISATGTGSATYKDINKVIDVTVNVAELDYNATDVISSLGYATFGLTPSGSNTYAQPDVASTSLTDAHGLDISIARNGSSNTKPRFDATYLRFYTGNTITISAPSGSNITKVVFVEPASGKDWSGSMEVETGKYDNTSKTWYAQGSAVSSITLTGITGTSRIGGIEVYLDVTSIKRTVSAAGYATFVPLCNVEVPSGVSAYYATATTASTVTMTEVGAIPAGVPVVLKSAGTHTFAVSDMSNSEIDAFNETAASANLLQVSDGDDGVGDYVLYNGDSDVGFYTWSGSPLAAGKVYLPKTTEASMLTIVFDDESTGIGNLDANLDANNAGVYNLQGQRVSGNQKGLLIKNGRKYIVK